VFGREIGLAFQLLDDVLDVAGPPERTGKARGTDLLDGTVTLPLILARERDPELAKLDLRELDAAGAEAACDRIAATGVLEEVRADARARVEEAKGVVASAPGLDDGQRRLLTMVADGVVERYA
jgi:geranylgeranyl pyrophosphate synthase